MKILCKLGIHKMRYKFYPFADQPFADDDFCATEGQHILTCKRCGLKKR